MNNETETQRESGRPWVKMGQRERDAWLAENVMGWEVDRSISTDWRVLVPAEDGSPRRALLIGRPMAFQWSPTTRLDDAFEVQERLRELPKSGGAGLLLAYGDKLALVVQQQEEVPYLERKAFDMRETLFLCAHAAAPQRAYAAYLTIMTARKEGWLDD